MKMCKCCGIEKEACDFSKDRRAKDGLQFKCKICEKEYKMTNRKQISKQQRAYRKTPEGKATMRRYSKSSEGKAAMQRYYLKLDLATAGRVTSRTLTAWAAQVKERDQCCQICGSIEQLEAHHIHHKSEWPEWALELSNGITLCKTCHKNHHSLNGY